MRGIAPRRPFFKKFPAKFPASREFDVETGSIRAASTTTQSCATGDFLKVYERPRIGGDLCDRSFSETARYSRQVVSASEASRCRVGPSRGRRALVSSQESQL